MIKKLLFLEESHPESPTNSLSSLFSKRDLIVGVALFIVAGCLTWFHASRMPASVLDGINNPDVYFSADCSRVHDNMVSRTESNHHRTNVHPLFSLLLNPLYQAVAFVSGNSPGIEFLSEDALDTAHLVSGLAGGISLALFYFLLRTIKTRELDSLLLCFLFASSAYALYWYAVPETYPWGVISILFAFLVSAIGCRVRVGPVWYLVASLGTFAITTTNWTVGLLAKLTRFGLKKAVVYSVVVLFVACVLALLQRQLVPSSWYFFRIEHESNYVGQDISGGPVNCLQAAVFHSMIAAEIKMIPHSREEGKTMMQMQASSPGSASLFGRIAVPLWAVLLLAGISSLVVYKGLTPFRLTLGIALLGQFVLHAVYGAETFLYSAHYGPMMILCLAFLLQSKFRVYALALIAILIGLFLANNLISINETMDYLSTLPLRTS